MEFIQMIWQEAQLNQPVVVLFFHSPHCSVCASMEPKLIGMIEEQHSSVSYISVNILENPTLAARFNVFTTPVLLIFTEGKEAIRRIQNFSLYEISQLLSRYEGLIIG